MNKSTAIAGAMGAAIALSGCTTAENVTNDPDRFVVKDIGNAHCVIWLPSDSGTTGAQMECDFK